MVKDKFLHAGYFRSDALQDITRQGLVYVRVSYVHFGGPATRGL